MIRFAAGDPGDGPGRYAPSPTGRLHLGNLRTALLAWLAARARGAELLVRIEDLDSGRSRESWIGVQLGELRLLGLDWDGDPVRQSRRGELYAAAIERLREQGLVYDCFCTRAEIREASPQTRVLLISGAGRISPSVARAAGASGFISKDWGAADVVKAVRMVALGSEVFAGGGAGDEVGLSDREREVLALVATGATNKEIAATLYLSPHTVKEHTSAIYRKLGVRNRAEAVKSAQTLGLVA